MQQNGIPKCQSFPFTLLGPKCALAFNRYSVSRLLFAVMCPQGLGLVLEAPGGRGAVALALIAKSLALALITKSLALVPSP